MSLKSTEILAILEQMSRRFTPAGIAPVMREIGEDLTESTKLRFSTSTGPEGMPWAPLAQSTVLARLQGISGAYAKKSGKLSAKGAKAVQGMKPLVESGILQDTIQWQLQDGGAGVEIGTNRFAGDWDGGAAVHQFGSRDGRIPARPFLGLSAEDEKTVLASLSRFLYESL